jgi:hypothetical protein
MPPVPMPLCQPKRVPRGLRPSAGAGLIAMSLAVSGCVSAGPILAETGSCSDYIPVAWRLPVPGADLPAGDTVGDWIVFGDQQTAQLDKSNGRLADTLHIVGECERRSKEAVRRSRPRFLGLF